jgi:hypothetical protein
MVQAVMTLQRLMHYGYCVSRLQIKGKPVMNREIDGSLDWMVLFFNRSVKNLHIAALKIR